MPAWHKVMPSSTPFLEMDRQDIFKRCPLLEPDTSDVFLVLGDDLDSYLSAMMFIKYHPAARIIGFYEQYSVLYLDKEYSDRLDRTLWIDLDVCHPRCHSLGHHMLRTSADESFSSLRNSCNLNDLRRIDCRQYERKYPLGTTHFLLQLYDESYNAGSDLELLLWLADSSYINGQQHRFRPNVEEWLLNFLQHPKLLRTFEEIDTMRFEEQMRDLYSRLSKQGVRQGKGQVQSRCLRLTGFQMQSTFLDQEYLRSIFMILSRMTGLPDLNDHMEFKSDIVTKVGMRTSEELSAINSRQPLERFIADYSVFSYVIVRKNRINYTAGITL
jgi:hypothetical protein